MQRFDVAVIGGGLLGCFAARNLCRWDTSVLLLEAREDVCTGISRANSAIIYPGYDHKPGTLKAAMTVRGNESFGRLCEELDVPFSRCGSLMLSYGPQADTVLRFKYERGLRSGVPGLSLLSGREAETMEPCLATGVSSALYAPTAGTVNPWELCIAACENARENGTQVSLNTRVLSIRSEQDGYLLTTTQGDFFTRSILNSAGMQATLVQGFIYPCPVSIHPTSGDYLILDRDAGPHLSHIIQVEPEDGGKGLNAVPTVEGNLLLGPSERENETDWAVSEAGLTFVRCFAGQVFPGFSPEHVIRSFAALRPNPQRPDGSSIGSFVIEHPAPGFWSLIGIKTPGLTCADQLGMYLAEETAAFLQLSPNPYFSPCRTGILRMKHLNHAARREAVRQNPDYGELLCRCEGITRGEVLEAIRRGAVTLDGLKHRLGTGMGACQGARCQQSLISVLAEAQGVSEDMVTQSGGDSVVYGGRDGTL